MRTRLILRLINIVAWSCILATTARGAEPLVLVQGSDLEGGAKSNFGTAFYGRQVNYVYAQPTGSAASMKATLKLERVPTDPLFLYLEAMDDDAPTPCRIRITLHGHEICHGPSGFPDGQWLARRFALPAGVLQAGANELSIVNEESSGGLGSPPWFMVAQIALAGAGYKVPQNGTPQSAYPLA
jgi:hypothetical protein